MRPVRIQVRIAGTAKTHGTGWWVMPDVVVTAFHVVGRCETPAAWCHAELAVAVEYLIVDGDITRPLIPIAADSSADVALLRCLEPPFGVSPQPLATRGPSQGQDFLAVGFPAIQGSEDFGLTGEIVRIDRTSPRRALQLRVRQGTDITWAGASGSAVTVAGEVVGVLTDETIRANTGWAAHVEAVKRLLQLHGNTDLRATLRQLLRALYPDSAVLAQLLMAPTSPREQDDIPNAVVERAILNGAVGLGGLLAAVERDHAGSPMLAAMRELLDRHIRLPTQLDEVEPSAGSRPDTAARHFGQEWFARHLQEAKATAGPRYNSPLRVGTPIHDVFEALCQTDGWFASLRPQQRSLRQAVARWTGAVNTRDTSTWGAPFPEQLSAQGRQVLVGLAAVAETFAALADGREGASPGVVGAAISHLLPPARELHLALRADLEKRYGKGSADSAGFRQFQAEYQCAFPAENVDAARDLVGLIEELRAWSQSEAARAAGARGILLAGAAGVGKTHAICDIAEDRLRRGLYTVVLFGEHFCSAGEPWDQIRQRLGLNSSVSRDELLSALDAAGRASGGALLLCIDGVNETRPRSYWRDCLASLALHVSRYPHLRLCVSCRSTYEKSILPNTTGLERVEHPGFAGMEYDACRQFFEYYGMEPPVTPILHPEFSNPLFLRLVCDTLRAAGERRMPLGWQGISRALQAFFREKNATFAREFDREPQERVPEYGMRAFVAEAERAQRVFITWADANRAISHALPSGFAGPNLLGWLVREGLLVADLDPAAAGPDAEDVVRVAFERLGEHLLAARLLDQIQPDGLTTAMEAGSLRFALVDSEAVSAYRGLVEALSIQLPEDPRFRCELLEALPAKGPAHDVLAATVAALPWRDPASMTACTQRFLLEALTTRDLGHETFEKLLAIGVQETAPDALWLHEQLSRQSMPNRDGFLCGYLHDSVGETGPVERLLRAPFDVDADRIPSPVRRRWATLLLWLCVAADRRVRDRATKGLVVITQPEPAIWAELIRQFAPVNDEYVVERCFCAAYGAQMRSRDPNAEAAVARSAYETVFVAPARIQNALIRDHARCIIELAAVDGAAPEIELARVRPPYESDWPLTIPAQEKVDSFKGARDDYPKLYLSCFDDDFFTYTLRDLSDYNEVVDTPAMARWIFQHVLDMGYGGGALASYDHYMLYQHGGGRGRPGWADRIGKKYQRIAFSRLAARLADHVEAKRESWESELVGIPLVLECGRDIDPSLLVTSSPPRRKGRSWWMPHDYDFCAVAALSEEEWTARQDDLPSTDLLLQPIRDRNGQEWQLLEGDPGWSSRSEEEERGLYRNLWMQIRGYLVDADAAEDVLHWLTGKDFTNHWMPQGVEFHSGFAGEYPSGVPFNIEPDVYAARGRAPDGCPAALLPVCNSLTCNYEGDAFQEEPLNINLPARVFFQGDRLRWDGLSGYGDEHGRLIFLDPSLVESGPPALLVDRSYILRYLTQHRKCLFWTVLGEKLNIGDMERRPRLTFSRVHVLDQEGRLRSSVLAAEVS